MNKYKTKITLFSPVCIALKRGTGNVIETLDYIPGSTIRGTLAMLYLRENGEYCESKKNWRLKKPEKEKFDAIFNSDKVRFGNCYPGNPEKAKVIPYTAISCKYFGEFLKRNFREDLKRHGVLDTLIPLAEYELIGKRLLSGEIEKKFERCPKKVDENVCDSVMDRFSGYYKQTKSTIFEQVEPSKRLIAHTEIMDSLETASPNRLYIMEVLNEKQEFIGYIEAEDSIFGDLKKLKQILEKKNLRIGSAKSRALGEIKLEIFLPVQSENKPILFPDEQWLKEDLRDRMTGMNNKIQEHLSRRYPQQETEYNSDDQDFKNLYFFSVTLHSDAILLDEIMRFKSTLEIQDIIESQPNLVPQQRNLLKRFKILRAWISTHLVSGWNSALKLPKEDDVVISKGSVFLFVTKSCQNIKEEEVSSLADILKQVEESGIGQRKNEGFGDIRICDEFHWEVLEK